MYSRLFHYHDDGSIKMLPRDQADDRPSYVQPEKKAARDDPMSSMFEADLLIDPPAGRSGIHKL